MKDTVREEKAREIKQNSYMIDVYVHEDRRDQVKDSFKLLAKQISGHLSSGGKEKLSLCDIGCATGDLVYYLNKCFGERLEICGMDLDDNLLEIARERMPLLHFYQRNILDANMSSRGGYDVICFFGVLSLLSDSSLVLEKLLSLVNRGGYCYIFSPFNISDYKVEYKYMYKVDGVERIHYEFGHSIQEISQWLDDKGFTYKWHPFAIGVDIPKRSSMHPVRAWTEMLADGRRLIIDQIDRVQNQYLLEIETPV